LSIILLYHEVALWAAALCKVLTIDMCITHRHILAAVHFNFNLQRECRMKADAAEQIKITYPKFKNGEAIVRNVRVSQNFGESAL